MKFATFRHSGVRSCGVLLMDGFANLGAKPGASFSTLKGAILGGAGQLGLGCYSGTVSSLRREWLPMIPNPQCARRPWQWRGR